MLEDLPRDCVYEHILAALDIHQSVDVAQNPQMSVLYASDARARHLGLLDVEAIEFDWNDVEEWLATPRYRNQMSRRRQALMSGYLADANVVDA